jgi:cell division protein ZapA
MENIVTTTIEILGKFYPIRCDESEIETLQEAAHYLNQKMQEVKESGKLINLERMTIVAALNMFLELKQQQAIQNGKLNDYIAQMQAKLDQALNMANQEIFYK